MIDTKRFDCIYGFINIAKTADFNFWWHCSNEFSSLCFLFQLLAAYAFPHPRSSPKY
jgi:hypothetical protein